LEQKSFESEWRRLLKISPRTADDYRRAHNRAVMDEELYLRIPILRSTDGSLVTIFPDTAGEVVLRMENGKATAIRSRMRE